MKIFCDVLCFTNLFSQKCILVVVVKLILWRTVNNSEKHYAKGKKPQVAIKEIAELNVVVFEV